MNTQFSEVGSKYGAPMGRAEYGDAGNCPAGSVELFRVNFVDGDYDDGGAYWGGGKDSPPLFCARGEDYQAFTRADSLSDAQGSLGISDGMLKPSEHPFPLDDFLAGYLETLIWQAPEGDDGELIEATHGVHDFSDDALTAITADCVAFCTKALAILSEIDSDGDHPDQQRGELWAKAAHDFCLTRNHHGAGFWDGDYPTHGDTLTDISETFSNTDVYIHGDKLEVCTG
jgi:hypothetical protein